MYLLTQLINRRSTIVKTKITSIVILKVHITWTSWAVAKVNTYNVMIKMIPVRWRFRWYSCDGCYRSATKLPMSLQTLESNFIKTHCQHAEIGKEDTRNIAYALIYVLCKYIYICRMSMSPIDSTKRSPSGQQQTSFKTTVLGGQRQICILCI